MKQSGIYSNRLKRIIVALIALSMCVWQVPVHATHDCIPAASLDDPPICISHPKEDDEKITTEDMLIGVAMVVGLFWIGGAFRSSNDLAGLRSEDDPDTGRFFVSPRIDASTDAGITSGITFGYQLRF